MFALDQALDEEANPARPAPKRRSVPGPALSATPDEERLIRYLAGLVKDSTADPGTDFHVALEVSLSFKRSAVNPAAVVAVTNDPNSAKVALSEETFVRPTLGITRSSLNASVNATLY